MPIDVSVIIPSYNKYPLNLYTLYSIEKQTFPSSRFEVLFIDDGSSDDTYKLKTEYHPSYSFRYIDLKKNLGRAKARNLGIKEAKGSILIFLDAEIMVHPNFIKHHFEMHQKIKGLVFTGVLGKFNKTYTILHPDLSDKAFREFYHLLKSQPYLRRKWNFRSKTLYKDRIRKLKLTNTPMVLFKREELYRGFYRKLSFSYPFLGNLLYKNYGENLEGFHFKWMAFLTGNVSVPKRLLLEAGAFDEDFKGYGFEDWELGYRLYEKGAHFKIDTVIPSYHQEHPVVEFDKNKEHRKNFMLFYQKHPSIKLGITALNEMYKYSFIELNKILSDYERLNNLYPNKFPIFNKVFKKYIDSLVYLYAESREKEGLPKIRNSAEGTLEAEFNLEMDKLQRLNGFANLKNLLFKK